MTEPASPAPVKSALRTLDLIELVVARPAGLPARDIALALGIPMSSLSYLLGTLCDRDYLVREGRLYRAGPGLDRLRLPAAALPLAERMAPVVRRFRAELNETVSFMVRRDWEAEVVVTAAGDHPLRYAIAAGERRPLHCLAAGKVLLAALDEEGLADYFAMSERSALTERTLTTEAALRNELGRIRRDGLATACEESVSGVCSVGFAVRIDGRTVGALSIAAPAVRFGPSLVDRFRALRDDITF